MTKRKFRRYKKTITLCLLLALAVLVFQGTIAAVPVTGLHLFSDACMIPGAACLGLALIKLSAYFGALDGLTFSAKWMATLKRKNKKDATEAEKAQLASEHLTDSFSEYCEEQELHRVFPDSDLFCGIALMLIATAAAVIVV